MKSDIFYWVLNMSIFGGLLCGIVLLLRRWKKMPKLLVYSLWSLPFLRLICPIGFTGKYNLSRLLERLGGKTIPAIEVLGLKTPGLGYFSGMNCVGAAQSYSPVTFVAVPADGVNILPPQSGPALQVFLETAALVWVVVAVGLLIMAGILYCFTYSELQDARREDGYWVSQQISAPAVYGVVRQRIVLPGWVTGDSISYILRHEQVHLRRRDNLWRCLAVAVCCVHWFNPLCWISLKYFLQDMELACDAAVLRSLPEDQHRDYAHTLLTAAGSKGLFSSAFGGAKLTTRVESILSYKRLTALSAAAFLILFLLLSYVLVTS